MTLQKNDEFELLITDMSDEGAGIGKDAGFTWFVKDAVIGDRVLAGVTKVKKHYGFARLIKVLEPSDARIEAPCALARQCGGCQLQALSYEEQLRFKERKVLGNLQRLGGFDIDGMRARGELLVEPMIGMEMPFRYRSKAQFPIGRDKTGKIVAGFYAGRTHQIIPCEDCMLGCAENRVILDAVIAHMERCGIEPYDEAQGTGVLRHVLIRKGYYTGELMVCLVINQEHYPEEEALLQDLLALRFGESAGEIPTAHGNLSGSAGTNAVPDAAREKASRDVPEADSEGASAAQGEVSERPVPHIASVSYSVNTARTNVIMGERIVNVYGPGYIEDEIHYGDSALRFRISPLAFYQVNPTQMERLYAAALSYAELFGTETVWDLYCGIGTISLFLAQKAKQVYGVEIIPQAIENARDNAARNGISNAAFYVGKAEEVLPNWYEEEKRRGETEDADVIVVDPPRKGCDERCLETMTAIAPKRIVYISCDSATLARDLKYLCANGYALKKVRACDMFGQTVHVETVCLLSKLTGK